MFSTILDKATGYFDKRALVSAFFPQPRFLGAGGGGLRRLPGELAGRGPRVGHVQRHPAVLATPGFFVWVAFWSFLTINFRMAYTRLFEGYWPKHKLLADLRRRRRERWQDLWTALSSEDDALEGQEAPLRGEQLGYQQLQASLASSPAPQAAATDADQVGRELDAFLAEAERQVFPSGTGAAGAAPISLSPREMQTLGQQTRAWWARFTPWLAEAEQNQQSPWSKRLTQLEKITLSLSKAVDEQVEQIQTSRLTLYRDLSLYYPPSLTDIMPTRLGNVLKASELYSWKRYRLDAVVVWSRLQSAIPDAFSTPLQDTKTSFDLMTTLCAFLLLFGVPLSVWIAVKSPGLVPWWAALSVALAALPFRLYLPAGLATLAVLLSLLISHPVPWVIGLQTLAVLLPVLALLFWLAYQNAVQAALDYGEKIKAAFDLYRWEVLKALHLQLPKDFEEERKVWTEVGGLLLRGYVPDLQYHRYAEEKVQDKETNFD